MSAIAIGKTPPATIPAATRIATRNEKLVATAPASAASVTMSRHAFISRVLPKKSPIVPSAGCTRAYGNANAEESSAAVLTSTRRSAAICGHWIDRAREQRLREHHQADDFQDGQNGRARLT